jgi:hypothetical protein
MKHLRHTSNNIWNTGNIHLQHRGRKRPWPVDSSLKVGAGAERQRRAPPHGPRSWMPLARWGPTWGAR